MKKFLKISGIVIGLLIILMIALPFLFKDKIVKIVKDEINNSVNAKVDFDDFGLTLFHSFPDFTFDIQGMKVIGTGHFENDTLAAFDDIFINFDLGSVFTGTYKVNSLSIEHPRMNLRILRDGKANWDIAKADTTLADKETGKAEETAGESPAFQMQLQEFRIIDAYINYDDKVGNQYARITGLNVELSGDFTESITDIDLVSTIRALSYRMDGVNYLKKANLNFEANIVANLDSSKYTFNENLLNINGLGIAFEGFVAMPGDNIVMNLKYSAAEATFKSLLSLIPAIYTTDFEDVKTSGKFSLNGWAKGVYNEVSMPAFGLNLKVKDAMFQYPGLPEKVDNIAMEMSIVSPSSDMDKMKIDINKFHFSIAHNPMDIVLKLRTLMSDPDIDAQVKGKFDLASLQKIYPMDENIDMSGIFRADLAFKGRQSDLDRGRYNKFKASGNMQINEMNYKDADLPEGVHIAKARMDFNPREINMTDFEMTYNKNTLRATGKLRNYMAYALSDGTLKGNMMLTADYLDFNKLMGEDENMDMNDQDSGENSSEAQLQQEVEDEMEVVQVPDNIDFVMQAAIGRMKYDELVMKSVYGKLHVAEKRVQLDNFHMEMLGGSLELNGYYSTLNPDTPAVALVLGMKHFDIKKSYDAFVAVQKFAPIASAAHGNYSALINFNSGLDSKMDPILNSVNAKGLISMTKVQIKGSKTFSELAKALNYDKLNNISTGAFDLPFNISDGKLEVKPFTVKVDDIPMTISGTSYLDQRIDYDIDMQVPREKLGSDANKMINSLVSQAHAAGIDASVGETINVKAKVTGTTTAPKIELNYKEAANDVQQQLQDELNKQVEALKKQAQEEAERLKKELEDKARQEYEKQKKELEKKKKEEEEKAKKKLEEEANKLLDDWF